MSDSDLPIYNPVFDEDFIDELLKIVAPDRETFLALCFRDIAAGYRREVEEAARRMFSDAR